MDALRNCHRMLTREGVLLDLHPIPPSMHAYAEGSDLGVVDEREFFRVVRRTEGELERTVAEGLFVLEQETELEVIERFDTLEELWETVDEWDTSTSRNGCERGSRVRRRRSTCTSGWFCAAIERSGLPASAVPPHTGAVPARP